MFRIYLLFLLLFFVTFITEFFWTYCIWIYFFVLLFIEEFYFIYYFHEFVNFLKNCLFFVYF
jgi:hypothetical protein